MQSTKPSPTPATALLCALASIALCATAGCSTVPASRVERLLNHPEFKTAAQFAPHFTADALHALADAEAEARRK